MTNKIVAQIAAINFSGNITPHNWWNVIRNKPTAKNPNGRPNAAAIAILSDVVYWYRPNAKKAGTTPENASNGQIEKRFAGDMLQKSYSEWDEKFGFGKRSIKSACDLLVELGLIHREFRTITGKRGEKLANVMFVQPVPDAIFAITHPTVERVAEKRGTSYKKTEHVIQKNGIQIQKNSQRLHKKNINHVEIVELFNEICVDLPKIRTTATAALKTIGSSINARTDENNFGVDDWRSFFETVAAVPFLNGKNNRQWRADLRWLLKPTNFEKVVSGSYGPPVKQTATQYDGVNYA